MANLRYTWHARERMRDRAIAEFEIDEAMNDQVIEYPHRSDQQKRS